MSDLKVSDDVMREVIALANNSLYGSMGFFLSTNGGEPDKCHLARPIEELKAYSNGQWRRAEALTLEVAQLKQALEAFRDHVVRHSCVWDEAANGSHHHPIWESVAAALKESPHVR